MVLKFWNLVMSQSKMFKQSKINLWTIVHRHPHPDSHIPTQTLTNKPRRMRDNGIRLNILLSLNHLDK